MEAEQEQALPHMQTPRADDNKNKVHLAMGGDVQQCLLSLRWALRNVPRNFTLVLVHVYRQATRIPTRCKPCPESTKEQAVKCYY